MNPNREEALFALALEKPAEKRAAFLDAMCDGDPALRQRLEALLAAHEQPDNLVPTQADEDRLRIKLDLAEEPPDEAVGQMLGRYKLLERVGEGGCGVVYVAEQTEPVRRRVALKVIKLGMDTKQVVARFEAERQALAMMDHPNIAKVLDAGTTDVGRPYFVMELVRGIKITDYCDQANLSTKERLDLFIKVCQAIQHAHQKGIIHRNIKPSNILVTMHDGVPVPKVIDFGIAKATEGRLTDNTVYTQLHQFIGTPAYMSPEQAEMSGLDIDTRSDIYSLGVLLYELLAGSTPFDAKELMACGIDEMRKTIRQKEPVRPSTRLATMGADELTTTAKRRSADASKLLHQLKGDLDWIVMKCLEKDRTRRYDTANGLAFDLKRHLNNEPVLARPPSAAYRLQKAWRRNRLMFAAAGAILAGLLVAMSALGFALVRERARKSESVRADSIAAFVTQLLHAAVPELIQQGDSKGVRLLLDSADELVTKTLTNAPAAELTLREALGFFQGVQLGNQPKSRTQYDRVEALLPLVSDDRLPPSRSRDDLRIDAAYARLFAGAVDRGRTDLEALAQEFLQRGPGANRVRARTLAMLGYGLFAMNRSAQAEPLLAEAYRLEPGRTASGLYLIDFAGMPYAQVLIRNGRYELAEEVARKTLSQLTADLGDVPLLGYAILVEADCKLGRFQAARKLIEEQVDHAPSQAWSPEQLLNLRMLRLAIAAYSGEWREAAPGFVALATNEIAGIDDWLRGAAAALASGDTNAVASLWRFGRTRYAGNAESDDAVAIFNGLALHPREEDVMFTLPDLIRRVEEGKDSHPSAVNLLFFRAELACRMGDHESARKLLNAWRRIVDERPDNALVLHDLQDGARSDLWEALILASLDRSGDAQKAYAEGARKLRTGLPNGYSLGDAVSEFYAAQALKQEVEGVFGSRGIAIPNLDPSR